MTNADELIKLKELLDKNIINQEEFELKKKELLNNYTERTINVNNYSNSNSIETKHRKKSFSKIFWFVFLGIMFMSVIITIINNPEIQSSQDVVLDVNQFFKTNKVDTITPQELIAIKGQPTNIEKWNYELNARNSYPIETYTYDADGEEYNFYNGKLSFILITKKISFRSKNSILAMFGLDSTNAKKVADTNYALRYTNCGASDFWVSEIENGTFSWVKIKLVDSPF